MRLARGREGPDGAARAARARQGRARPRRRASRLPPAPRAIEVSERERAVAALRREVERNSEYVGLRFAAEARAIHGGEAPERAIYGEARPEEARALLEDGIPVAPLPFVPKRKSN